jgi:hypothetical protein
MTTRDAKRMLSVACQLAGCFFVAMGLVVWWWWSPWPRTRGVVRMERALVGGEEVLVPVVQPLRREERWVADLPRSSLSRYREGDVVTVIVRKKGIVKPPVSVSMSPSTDFVIGAAFLIVGWRLARRRSDSPAGQHFYERAV